MNPAPAARVRIHRTRQRLKDRNATDDDTINSIQGLSNGHSWAIGININLPNVTLLTFTQPFRYPPMILHPPQFQSPLTRPKVTTCAFAIGLIMFTVLATGTAVPRPTNSSGEDEKGLRGVIQDRDAFEFHYDATLPEFTSTARMWIPLPATDEFQTVTILSMRTPGTKKIVEDLTFGNRILFIELEPEDSGKTIEIRMGVTRNEKSHYRAVEPSMAPYLKADRLTPVNETFREIGLGVIEGHQTDLEGARALYDHVIETLRYQKIGTGWGKGDALYACDARSGNCTDFHAYFIALARSVGIPARFAIGAAIPFDRNEGPIGGYHCWAEFYADGKWWPVDISEADKHSSLTTYYFGHHPANRIEFSRGRDIVVDPLPKSGPISFLAYPLLEVEGEPTNVDVAFSFNRLEQH